MKEAIHDLVALPPPQSALARAVARSFVALHCAAGPDPRPSGPPVAVLADVHCAPPFGPVALRGISLALHRGERLAILGPNGAGKTTLGATLAGVLRPRRGRRAGALGGLCLQNPENQFLTASVRDELEAGLQGGAGQVDRLLEAWGLAGLGERHPLEQSQGQNRRHPGAHGATADRQPLGYPRQGRAAVPRVGAALR